MFKNHHYEKALGKLNEVLSENGMNIEAVNKIDINTYGESAETEKKYYCIKADILVPTDD